MAGEEEPVEADPVGRRAFTRSVRGCDWVNEDGPTRAPAPNLEGQFKRLKRQVRPILDVLHEIVEGLREIRLMWN